MSLRHSFFSNDTKHDQYVISNIRDFMSINYSGTDNQDLIHLAHTKSDDEMVLIINLYRLGFKTIDYRISHVLLRMNSVQLNELIKQFSTMKTSSQSSTLAQAESQTVQIYMCYSISYPECANALVTYDDDENTLKFKIHVLKSNHSAEQKKRYLDLAEHLMYDINIFDLYASLVDHTEYDELVHLATPFKKLYYDVCCSRVPGTFYNYLKIIFSAPREKRILIADYILQAGYKSLYVAQNICEYFSTLTPTKMEFSFYRAKGFWGDEYIDKEHRFERLFIDLLKIDYEPCEVEIAIMAMSDVSCRQDIDYCYWDDNMLDDCNEITKQRLGGYIDIFDYDDYDDDDYDIIGTEFETAFFKKNNNREHRRKFFTHKQKICKPKKTIYNIRR